MIVVRWVSFTIVVMLSCLSLDVFGDVRKDFVFSVIIHIERGLKKDSFNGYENYCSRKTYVRSTLW